MKELIVSVQSLVPKKGTNASKPMWLVNGKYWVKTQPDARDTHIVTEEVTKNINGVDRTFTNVVGYSTDVRMTIQDKFAMIKQEPPEYSQAFATLLR